MIWMGNTSPEWVMRQKAICFLLNLIGPFIFTWKENEAKENARVALTLRVVQPIDEAAPRAVMRRWPPSRHSSSDFLCCGESPTCSSAHNLAIAARLASSGALPDDTILASSTG
jgi:hypothetical protein